MLIPVSFKLLGQTIKVSGKHTLMQDEDAGGHTVPDRNEICIQSLSNAYRIPQSRIEHIFCHELVHLLFANAGYEEDCCDEVKVERIAGLLHQAFSTMRYAKHETTKIR